MPFSPQARIVRCMSWRICRDAFLALALQGLTLSKNATNRSLAFLTPVRQRRRWRGCSKLFGDRKKEDEVKEGQLNNASLSCNYNYTINGFMPFFRSARCRDGPLDDRLTLFYSLRALPLQWFRTDSVSKTEFFFISKCRCSSLSGIRCKASRMHFKVDQFPVIIGRGSVCAVFCLSRWMCGIGKQNKTNNNNKKA